MKAGKVVSAEVRDKVRGCLLGVAIGDALGAPYEGISALRLDVKLQDSMGRIVDFQPYDGFSAGTWTDDTGMTLAACRALTEHEKTGKAMEECFRKNFRDWANSSDCRRPGHTVYHASKYGVADENSWGSGALMRSAPIGIYAYLKNLNQWDEANLAMFAAKLTHGHPLATFPTTEFVRALVSIFSGEDDVPKKLSHSWKFTKLKDENDPRNEEYQRLRIRRMNPNATASEIGQVNGPSLMSSIDRSCGLWIWKEVLEVCLHLADGYSWTMMPGFEEGILKTVNDSYDRDTAGAVAGALLGAYWGLRGIPERWIEAVHKRDEILALADEMIEVNGGGTKREECPIARPLDEATYSYLITRLVSPPWWN